MRLIAVLTFSSFNVKFCLQVLKGQSICLGKLAQPGPAVLILSNFYFFRGQKILISRRGGEQKNYISHHKSYFSAEEIGFQSKKEKSQLLKKAMSKLVFVFNFPMDLKFKTKQGSR